MDSTKSSTEFTPPVINLENIGEPETNEDQNIKSVAPENRTCPYLDTIDRKALDFDFEKLCSVSLSKINVYACLICGKYFQGKGKSTHAFIHSVNENHHVFLNLETLKFYCLPDNYEIKDSSLDDILYVLRPTFTVDEINKLNALSKAYDGKEYYPGIVGLNNLKYNDYCNVVFQALSHVTPLRDYFLLQKDPSFSNMNDERYLLRYRFGELIRKLWNPRNFKTHVSPHEMLQAIVLSSKKRFEFTKQSDPIVFLGWLLNSLLGPKREKNSIIKRTLQGKIRIASRYMIPNLAEPLNTNYEQDLIPAPEERYDITNFLYLTLDLPSMPLFPKKDEKGKVIKPRVSIYDLLNKFDGKSQHEFRDFRNTAIKRFEILKLPRYLILNYQRFTENTFFTEKNTHIVDYNIQNLDMSRYMPPVTGSSETDAKYTYTLIANIVHDGEPQFGKGTYRCHINHTSIGKWFELQDLYVTEIPDTTLITLSESYIQIWKLDE